MSKKITQLFGNNDPRANALYDTLFATIREQGNGQTLGQILGTLELLKHEIIATFNQ